ncbi:MAG: hypothetical protein QNJ05_03420 [Woeseiaceae bacterium]|nr:hypothetical protein [Woeseiaceae bacterium]
MECLLQYWDELDDLFWLVPALKERIRRSFFALTSLAVITAVAGLSVLAAMQNPSSALVIAAVMTYGLVLRKTFGDPDFEQA